MSIRSEIDRITVAKGAIRSAIEAKGVTVPDTATLSEYAAKIGEISSGPVYEEYDIFSADQDPNIFGVCYRLGNIGHVIIRGGNPYEFIPCEVSDIKIDNSKLPYWLSYDYVGEAPMCGILTTDAYYSEPINIYVSRMSGALSFNSPADGSGTGYFFIHLIVKIG